MDFRLPAIAKPKHYDLFIDLDLKKFRFAGNVVIDLEIPKPTNEIVLNAAELKIKSAQLILNKQNLTPQIKLNPKNEQLILKFNKKISGRRKLIIEFSGALNDSLLGIYRSKYKGSKGKEKYLAATQFESHYARKCFPCFDEPAYKATFDLTVRIDSTLKAISNMPIKKETQAEPSSAGPRKSKAFSWEKDGKQKIISFQTSPKMSTYLLCLCVGEFEFLKDKYKDVEIRVATVPGKSRQGKFALDLTKKFLKYFEDYSGVKYPLPKLDLVALPDFQSGAMENWGIITFREILLLFDPKITSTAIKKRVAEVIAHELWHQWSGNLVTMEWWNDLWLNESFATYMAYKAAGEIFPQWKIWEDFISEETEIALNEDSLKSTHPIEVEIKTPTDITEVFDAISYNKGGSILRMLDTYLGEENFRRGVSKYLNRHAYKNATSEAFWDCLASASKQSVEKIMHAWIRQAGFPLVEAELNGNNLELKQKRFAFQLKDKTVWPIPLVIKTNAEQVKTTFDKQNAVIKLNAAPEWFKLNYGQAGFYRVKYSDANLAKLRQLVGNKTLSAADRWGVQNDLFRLTKHGELAIDKYLDFLRAYRNEDSFLVLADIFGNLWQIYYFFSQESFWNEIWPKFREICRPAFRKVLARLGWQPRENEPEEDRLLRSLAIKFLVFTEDSGALKIGKELFEKYLKTREIHPDLRSAILYVGSRTGGENTYAQIVQFYKQTKVPEEQKVLLGSLGGFKNSDLLKKTLEFGFSKDVRMQDTAQVISSVSGNPLCRPFLLDWAASNWKKIEKLKSAEKLFVDVLEDVTTPYSGREKLAEAKKFFKTHKIEYKMVVNNSLETIKRNTFWIEKNKAALQNYFA